MSFDPVPDLPLSCSVPPHRLHARVAWLLMMIVAVISLIPFLGFASWLIAGPVLLVSFIMIVLVFSKGGVAHGLVLLGCQLIVMPIVVIFGPVVSSLLGISGAAAGTVAATESSPRLQPAAYDTNNHPRLPIDSGTAPGTGTHATDDHLPDSLRDLKSKMLAQQPQIDAWLRDGHARETPTAYLVAADNADLEIRKTIVHINKYRQAAFELIAQETGKSVEDVAKVFVKLKNTPLKRVPTN